VAKIKTKAATVRIPQTKDEAVSMIAEIGNHQRDRKRLQADMDDRLTAIREEYQKQLAPHEEAIKSLTSGVHTWAEANRSDLTNGGKVKTAQLMTGEIRWRVTPPSCKLVRVKEAIEELKTKKLTRFIREKDEVNKEAILADQEAVKDCKWISIEQSEEFVIVPLETALEEVA
jgi:phage host-nuclease inhibitor protein Gam